MTHALGLAQSTSLNLAMFCTTCDLCLCRFWVPLLWVTPYLLHNPFLSSYHPLLCMMWTKQMAKKSTGGMAPQRWISLLVHRPSPDAAHDKVIKKNTIQIPTHKWPTDLEGAKQIMGVNTGCEVLVSLLFAVLAHLLIYINFVSCAKMVGTCISVTIVHTQCALFARWSHSHTKTHSGRNPSGFSV